MDKLLTLFFFSTLLFTACNSTTGGDTAGQEDATAQETADTLAYEQEKHLANIRQLTFGGNNAEAYFSFDNKELVFQSDNPEWGLACDQIFYMPVDKGTGGEMPPMVSTGKGRTTCSFFMPGNEQIVYASTHLGGDDCPEAPRVVNGKYVWGIHKEYDIFVADKQGNIVKQLTDSPGYDAEATVSPDGTTIVFTSTRSGDLELWLMNIDGSDQRQVTSELGYDGGAFFTPDSKGLVFRASRPTTDEAVSTYKELLAQGLVQPTDLEIFVCDLDGSNLRQVWSAAGLLVAHHLLETPDMLDWFPRALEPEGDGGG